MRVAAAAVPRSPVLRTLRNKTAGCFAFERTEGLGREFPLPDWQRQESDLLFHISFQEAGLAALVCVLVEHQSAPDPSMGVVSAGVAFGPFGEVIEAVFTDGQLVQFDKFGVHHQGTIR
jgi:Putative transposase, YhgA-like